MAYQVDFTPEAQQELKALSGYVRAQALALLHGLAENPRLPRAKELRGRPSVYRLWLAKKWRIVYRIDDTLHHVLILRIRLKEQIDYESL